MEIRYLGFEQQLSARVFRFDVMEKGQPTRRCVVTADMALFLSHRVGIQEGPTLCAGKLAADMEKNFDGAHELTAEDLRLHVDARSQAEARRAEMRKTPRRRPAPAQEGAPQSSWRKLGV